MKRFCLAVGIIFLIFFACGRPLEAATYTIGGPAGPTNYATLAALFTAVPNPADGDVIVLYQDDSSLKNQTLNLPATITIQSNDPLTPRVISMNNPASPPYQGGIFYIIGSGTLDLNGVTFSDGSATLGGAIYTNNTLTFNSGGTYTFNQNLASS